MSLFSVTEKSPTKDMAVNRGLGKWRGHITGYLVTNHSTWALEAIRNRKKFEVYRPIQADRQWNGH